jgi:hypothetical protein
MNHTLRKGAESAGGAVHLGFNHDFSKFAESCACDKAAIETLGGALAGKPLVVAAGVAGVRPGFVLTEDVLDEQGVLPRKSEQAALKFDNAAAVRLPPSVYGDGKAGFVSVLLDIARKTGVSAYAGDGQNKWPAVHYNKDAAKAFALALGKSGVFHAIGDEGITVREIAEFIGQKLNTPVVSKTEDEAAAHFGGFFGRTAALDCPAASEITRNALGWKPTEPGLFEELEKWL